MARYRIMCEIAGPLTKSQMHFQVCVFFKYILTKQFSSTIREC